MAVAPTPSEIFQRAVDEGERRLNQSMLELVSTGFIAGFERRERGLTVRLLRLWFVTLLLNLVGGGLFALVVSVRGVLPNGGGRALGTVAEEIAGHGPLAGFVSAIVGGALVALLSFLLQAVDSVGSRITVAFFTGFLLAVGPFDHVVVTALHLFLGILFGASVSYATLATFVAIAAGGNLVGGVGW